jgi:hypothetical protein
MTGYSWIPRLPGISRADTCHPGFHKTPKSSAQIGESIRLNGQNEGRSERRHKALRRGARIHLFFFYKAPLELFMRI